MMDLINREEVHDLIANRLSDYLTDESRNELEELDVKIEDDIPTVKAVPIEVLQKIWNKTYRLHPINRGDNDYANGVYDGMCRVIDIVCNTIDSKIKELSE